MAEVTRRQWLAGVALMLPWPLALGKAVQTRKVDLARFERIHSDLPADIVIVPGSSHSLSLTAEPHVIDAIEWQVVKNTLHLSAKKDFQTQRGLTLVVGCPALKALHLAGSSDVVVEPFDQPALNAVITGSAGLMLKKLNLQALTVDITGSGSIQADGKSQQLIVNISGAGDFDGEQLIVAKANASISGSGDIVVHATETLTAKVSGAGAIAYLGEPVISSRIDGAGSVEPH